MAARTSPTFWDMGIIIIRACGYRQILICRTVAAKGFLAQFLALLVAYKPIPTEICMFLRRKLKQQRTKGFLNTALAVYRMPWAPHLLVLAELRRALLVR